MKKKFLELTRREYTSTQRFLFLLILGILFLVVLPAALVSVGFLLDRLIGLPNGVAGFFQLLVGLIIAGAGAAFAIWSIYVQFTRGRGTPVPLMATQRLIVTPPYAYSRNPMALGTIILYTGVAIMAGSWGALILVILGSAALLLYIRDVEEAEMVARFGKDYEVYRRNTPFIIPRFSRRG